MKLNHTVGTAVLLTLGLAAPGAAQPPAAAGREVQAIHTFEQRVHDYVQLHDKLQKDAPPLRETSDPAKIRASQEALARALQAARAGARQGDIFTPEVAAAFKRLMYPEVHGREGVETRAAIKDAAPAKSTPIKVNGRYPSGQPLPTVPPNLLAALPKLPDELEYRVVHRDLILRDIHANLIVDYIPNAIQTGSAGGN